MPCLPALKLCRVARWGSGEGAEAGVQPSLGETSGGDTGSDDMGGGEDGCCEAGRRPAWGGTSGGVLEADM